jgi:ketosteroid isomerase-like protein
MNINRDQILDEIRLLAKDMTHYSETAQSDAFLQCYAETPDFLAISADGIIRNYRDFKEICKTYYSSLKEQKLSTTDELIRVFDDFIAVLCWSGNIDAYFKNGDVMKMQHYTATYLFKKIGDKWKIIHSHESTLPPELIKSK